MASFDPRARSPTLRKLLKSRLAPVREEQLLNAAKREEKPVKPPAGDCCGSSCNPCVMDLYREELKCWKECWIDWAEQEKDARIVDAPTKDVDVPNVTPLAEASRKMPGSFDW